MKKLLVILALSGLSSIANAATPNISSVTGTVATGQNITITGTNMVNENTANYHAWYAGHALASGFEGASFSADGYTAMGENNSTVKLLGNKSYKVNISGASSVCPTDNLFGGATLTLSSPLTNYWLRGYVRYNSAGNLWAASHLKMFDLQAGSGSNAYVQWAPTPGGNTMPGSMRITTTSGGATTNADFPIPSGQLTNDRWYLVELQVTGTSVTVYLDGALLGSKSKDSNNMQYLRFGVVNACGTSSGFNLNHWEDNLAVSTEGGPRLWAASKIEISNNSTYGSGTVKYQAPVYLSDGTAQIKADLTGLGSGPFYLWVTNNQQQRSAAFPLSGGSGGGSSDTVPPAITSFTLPSTAVNLTVPVSTFIATDDSGVTGYCVTTTNNSSGCSWVGSAPSTVTFGASGTKTAYGWTKDAAGNISTPATDSVTITLPGNGACGSASGQSFSSLSSVSPNLCGTGTVASFSGSGPWTWGCNGSNGGSNTASNACTASLSSTSSTPLFSESFENNNFAARGWYDNTNHGTIVSGGQSGNCLQWAWTSGATSATNGGSMRMEFTPTDSLYLTFYVKFQAGWRGSQKAYHPHMLYFLSDLDNAANAYSPLANNYLDTYVEFLSDVGSPYTIRPLLAIQDEKRVNTSNGTPPNNLTAVTENRSVAYCNTPVSSGAAGTCYADNPYYSANTWKASSASLSTDAWHKVEVYFKMNSISGGKGQSDGIMQEWIDGVQVINHSDVLYRTNQDATKKWAQVVLAPFIGDGSPIAQAMWIDELTVATSQPNDTSLDAPSRLMIKSVTP